MYKILYSTIFLSLALLSSCREDASEIQHKEAVVELKNMILSREGQIAEGK